MPIEQVVVPQAGESIAEATVNRWLVPDGSFVKVDDPIYELGTDKATQEIAAPVAGVLTILVPEGATVAVGAVVARIDTDAKSRGSGSASSLASAASRPGAASLQSPLSPGPAAARLLEETGLSASAVVGTAPGGRVTKADVLEAARVEKQPPAPVASTPLPPPASAAPTPPGVAEIPGAKPGSRLTRRPMSQVRKRIAQRLLESQNQTATLTTFNEADMSGIMALRAKYNDKFEKKHGVKLGFMSLFVKASIEALKAFPLVNSRIDGAEIVDQHFHDIGVAVSTEKGLMVPILRDADRMSFAEIEKAIAGLAKKAREGKIAFTDLEGGTFTITNGGTFGSMLSTPILNPPQSAILGMHTITKRPVVIDDEIAIRPMMYLALSYDHRIIDGREAVQFLVRIKECVENPERMLLEI